MSQLCCLPVTLIGSVFLAVFLLYGTSAGWAWAVEIEGQEKRDNGAWIMTHVFKDSADAELFNNPFGPGTNAKVDASKKSLVFKPAPFEGLSYKASAVTYPGKLRVSFMVEADLEASGNDFEFQINPMPTKQGQRQATNAVLMAHPFKTSLPDGADQ